MKHAWIMVLVLLVWPIGSVGLQRGLVLIEDSGGRQVSLYRESHALLIGVSKYTGSWPSLPGVKSDLKAVKVALEQHGFEVEVVKDPNQATLEEAYEGFIGRHGLARDNRLLFYFAGHGYTVKPHYATDDPEDWMGYIVTRDAPLPDADFRGFLKNAMSMQRFEELAKQIQAKHALFVFDSCFSGSVFAMTRAPPENISHKTTLPVRQFITSGSADQEVPDRSEFRHQFVAALAGTGDLTGDGYITGSELGIFLEDKVTNYSKRAQTPKYGKLRHRHLDKGDFVFALAEPPPPPLVRRRGNVQVDVNVPATVYLNDQRVGEAQPDKPLNQRNVPVGRTAVRVEAPGFQPATQTAQVQRGKWSQLIFDLVPLQDKARLTVRSNVYQDRVYIDGQEMGRTRLDVELAAGRHTVRVEKDRYAPYEETVELRAGSSAVVRATLRKLLEPVQQAEAVTPKRPAVTLAPETTSEPRQRETWTEPMTGMEFVWAPPDCFQMGSGKGDEDEKPVHRVCVKGFWLGKYEVTQGEWKRVMGNNPAWYKSGEDYPVEQISWEDAQAFIGKLNAKGPGGLRLPSEAEWEYACRSGGRSETYCGGEDVDSLAWFFENSDKKTHPVGGKRANGLGLYDMSGNVREWVHDCYDSYVGAPDDGSARDNTNCDRRVSRGGGWNYEPRNVRSADRGRNTPDNRTYDIGFRLARTP